VGVLATGLAACGSSGGRQDASEPTGKFPVSIVSAKFPPRQQLAQTSNLTLGKLGKNSVRPFSIRDPQQGLAVPDRPVWILEQDYPKLVGSSSPAGAETANEKTFDFGRLKPGATTSALWRVTPVKPGTYTVLYRVDAGLTGNAKAVTGNGSPPTGSFHVKITDVPPLTRVNGQGQVVEIGSGASAGGGKTKGGGKSASSGGNKAKSRPPKQPANEPPAVPQGGGSLPPSGSGQ